MGYRFSLDCANIVGHLAEGNLLTFIENTFYSNETYFNTMQYLKDLMKRPHGTFYTSPQHFKYVRHELELTWDNFYNNEQRLQEYIGRVDNVESMLNNNALRSFITVLKVLHKYIGDYNTKSLLLPGFERTELNEHLISEKTLVDLLKQHPRDSVIIFQTKELPECNNIHLYNVFKHFDTAASNIDKWPGILLWNKSDSVFVPISNKIDLKRVFDVIHFEKDYVNLLKEMVTEKENKSSKYAYLLHLSDLHFGNQQANRHRSRLLGILEKEIQTLNDCEVFPVITGDLLDSPTQENMTNYYDFVQLLMSKGANKPVSVLGNHDVDKKGFLKSGAKEKNVIEALSTNCRVELIKPIKVAFLRFYSNTGGNLAQGQIGEQQLLDVGNELDKIKDLSKYTIIAVLHHHPKSIEEPDWKAKELYERILGKNHEKTMRLLDADLFLEWLQRRNIKYVLHGHKHIPMVHNHNDVNIISAGSSTGVIKHKEKGKTYITYNVIKYDVTNKKPISCAIRFEDIVGSGVRHLSVTQF